MDSSTILAVALATVVAAAGLLTLTTTRRRDGAAAGRLSRETRRRDRSSDAGGATALQAEAAPTGREVERAAMLERRGTDVVLAPSAPAPVTLKAPMDPETLGITRRKFFNRSIVALFTAGLGGFGAACLAFIWPSLSGGFGSKINVGKLDDILSEINDTKKPKYVPEGRFYLNPYPKGAVGKANKVYAGGVLEGMESGVVALYQRCVHLGCRVPWCGTSQWFECPCHGSQYNRVGEKKAGPAPRGLDRFAVEVKGGIVSVDTKAVIQGPVIGTNTTGQEAEGPHCTGGGH